MSPPNPRYGNIPGRCLSKTLETGPQVPRKIMLSLSPESVWLWVSGWCRRHKQAEGKARAGQSRFFRGPEAGHLVMAPSCLLPSFAMQGPPIYLASDVHLGAAPPETEEAFLAWLEAAGSEASKVVINGDLFDFWFEYPWVEPTEHLDVMSAIARLADSGTDVVFLGGNHDYWAGPKLARLSHASVHRTPVTTSHFDRRLFIAHGDGLPEGDRKYKVLRAVLRSRVAIAGFTLIPPRIGAAIARWASNLSEITDERIERAIPAMRRFLELKLAQGYDVVVVGHIHRQMVWESDGGTAVVVGDWMEHRSVIEMTADGLRPLRWTGDSLVEEPRGAPHQ